MNLRDIWILYTMELRSALRERSIVVNSILMPIFLYPVLLWVMFSTMTFIQGLNEGFTSRIALVGDPPFGHEELIDSLGARDDVVLDRELGVGEAIILLQAGDLDALISFGPPDEEGAALVGNFLVDVDFDSSESRSRTAVSRIRDEVQAYRIRWISRVRESLGITSEEGALFRISDENVSSQEDLGTLILLASYPEAIDQKGRIVGTALEEGEARAFLLTPEDTNGDGQPDLWFRVGSYGNALVQDLGTLGGDSEEALAISGVCRIAGYSNLVVYSGPIHGFVRTPAGTLIDIGTLGGNVSAVGDLNNLDEMVGASRRASSYLYRAFFARFGTLPVPAGNDVLLRLQEIDSNRDTAPVTVTFEQVLQI